MHIWLCWLSHPLAAASYSSSTTSTSHRRAKCEWKTVIHSRLQTQESTTTTFNSMWAEIFFFSFCKTARRKMVHESTVQHSNYGWRPIMQRNVKTSGKFFALHLQKVDGKGDEGVMPLTTSLSSMWNEYSQWVLRAWSLHGESASVSWLLSTKRYIYVCMWW